MYKSIKKVTHTISKQTTRWNEKINLQIKQHLFMDSSSFCAASDDVCHFKRDNNLELTRWTWLQADHAHICAGVVQVAACETPATLSNRRVECLRPWKPHVGRACSLLDRRMAEVIWDPLCQDFSNGYARREGQHSRHCGEVQIALHG